MVNVIPEFAKARGCKNAYELCKATGLPQATIYRLYNDPTAYPSKETQEAICRALDAQPGDFLRYVPDEDKE
ncbi:helix-turn-helix transcriptional regulator [Pseudanabaena sp. FACHB-2040]|uniref:helix-turn-helix domain-containing protein n=1 Tax=Pseudanabaena sp. FACHB-2040 TaxID=2692859 RepID=UPI00168728F3|nr:helix-turn-helix transcriptional regulator [Pseudanabaena sp. FACHB-2040]MBD2259271.1 helix-turn-helix transcriptional regulator [Pseudanabaena sp. FACHB-2040]